MTTTRLALSLALFLMILSVARAQTQTYTSPNNGNFTNPLVWNFGLGPVPASSSGLTLNFLSYGTATVAVNNDLNLTLNRLNLNSFGSGALSLNGSSTGAGYAFTGAAQVHLLGSGGTSGLSARVVLASTATGLTLDGAGASGLAINSFISSNTAVGAPLTIATDARNAGTGIVQLTVANSFAGGVVLSSGTLNLLEARALGDRNNTLTVQGGQLQLGVTVANNLTLSSTLNVNSPNSGTLSGLLSGTGFGINMRPSATTATLSLTGPNTYTGATVVGGPTFATAPLDGAGRLSISGAVGSILTTSGISIRDGAALNLRYAGGASASNNRVATGTSIATQSGFLQVVGNAGVVKQSVGTVNAGGLTTLAALTNDSGTGTAGAATELTVANLVRTTGATVVFEGQNLGLNAVTTGLGAAQGNVILTQINGTTPATALVGGTGGAGTAQLKILPWALGDAANSGNLYNGGSGFVTLGANGVRLLDTGTEYNLGNNLNTAGTTDNVRITAAPTALSAAKTVNSLYFATTGLTQSGAFNLTLSSGALASNVAAATISSPVLFGPSGTGEAVISVVDTLAGTTNRLTLSGGFTAASLTKSGHGDLTISTTNPVISGGITINGGEIRVDAISRLGGATSITVNGHSQAAERAGLHFLHSGLQTLAATTPITVNAGTASITLNRHDATLAVNSVISGSGGVSYNLLSTGGVITIGGVNTYTGPTFISGAGTVSFDGNDARLGSSADPNASFLNLGGSTLQLTGAWTSARAIHISGGSTLDTQANNATLSGPITGAFGLTKTGAGTLTIGGTGAVGLDSSYSGQFVVSTGTLAITGNGAINAASIILQNSSALTFNGAADIDTTDGSTTPWRSINELMGTATNTIALGASAGTPVDLRVNSSAVGVATPISGFGKLVKVGSPSNTLTLSGTNTFTGGVEVWGGVLNISADNQLGNSANGITLAGGILASSASLTTSRAITLAATPQPIISSSSTVVLNNGLVGGTLTLNGAIGGSGGFNMSGGGSLILGTANNYAGDTQISGGTLSFTNNNQLGGATSRIRLNGGTLQSAATSGTVTINRPIIVTANNSFVNVGTGATLELAGPILGTRTNQTIMIGAGALTISGSSSSFFGTLQIGGGTSAFTGQMRRGQLFLVTGSAATLSMSGLTRELGGLSLPSGTTAVLGTGGSLTTGFNNPNVDWVGNITGNSAASVTAVGTGTLAIQSNGNTFGGGFHLLSGASGTTTISGSGTLPVQSAFTLGAWGSSVNKGPLLVLDNTGTNLGTRLADTQVIHSNAGDIQFSTNTTTATSETIGSLRGAGMTTVTMTTGGTLTFGDATNGLTRLNRGTFLFRAANTTLGTAAAMTSIANVTFGNSGSLGLIGGGGSAGTTTISILPYAVADTIPRGTLGNTLVTYGANGARPLDTTTEFKSTLTGAGPTENVRLSPSGTVITTLSGGADVTVNALVISDVGSIRLESAGTEKLILASGALLQTSDVALSGVYAVNSVGTAGINLGVQVAELQTGAGNTRELIVTAAGNLALGAKVTTSGGLTKSSTGSLYLTNAANTYTGATTINAGSLVIDSLAALGGSTTLQMGGGFLKYRGGNATLTQAIVTAGGSGAGLGGSAGFHVVSGTTLTTGSASISGNGGILKDGTGVLVLQGTNTHSGATIISGGALVITSAAALGTNNRVIFADGGTSNNGGQVLRFDANNITLDQDFITNTSQATIGFGFDTNGNNATLTGPLLSTTSTRGLYKFGAGNLTLTATQMYTGATQVFGGTLTLSGANGSILNSTGTSGFMIGATTYIAPGAALVLDNAAANNNNRLPDVWDTPFGTGNGGSGSVRIDGAELKIIGNSSGTPTQEKINGLTINYGTITLQNGNAGVQLVSGLLTRFNTSTSGLIRGDNLGGTPGAGSTNWFVTDLGSGGVQLGGAGGAEGTPFVNILPGFMGATTATGLGSDFLTYAADTGFRPLTAGEYQSTIPPNNFDLNRAPNIALTGAATVNETSAITALKLGAGASVTGNGTLYLSQSTILAAGSASISVPMLSTNISGSNNAITFLTPASGTTLTVDSVVAAGQLSKYGEGTVLLNQRVQNNSFVVVAQGTLKLGAGGALNPAGGALFVLPGATFDLNGADRLISALSTTSTLGSFNMGQRQDGTVTLGANRLTLFSNSNATWSGSITGSGGLTKAFTSSGTSTFTQPLAYTGSTVLRAGTLQLASMGTLASTAIELRGGSLAFNNTDDNAAAGGYIPNRIGTTVPITWAGGTITFTENANTPAQHSLGAATLAGGANLTITNGSTAPSTTTFANLIRSSTNRGTLTITATNLGLAQSPVGGARILSTQINGAAPGAALIGAGGAVGTTTQSILPWAWSSTASSFLTLGADGFRPLNTTSEYDNNISIFTPTNNVRTTSGVTLIGDRTVNSLIHASTSAIVGAFDLTLTSGALATTATSTIGVSTNALLSGASNNRELVVNTASGTTVLNYNLTTTGGVTKFGAGQLNLGGTNNTFTGGLAINQGTVVFTTNNQLGAAGGAVRFGGTQTNPGTLFYAGSTALVFDRPVETVSMGGFSGPADVRWQLNGVISGPGGVRYNSNISIFEINAVNTYTGPTELVSGHTIIKADSAFGSGGDLYFNNSLSQGVILRGDWTTSRRMHFITNGILIQTGGYDATWNGELSGAQSLIKSGTGSLILTAPMAYTGAPVLNSGALVLRDQGSLAVSDNITVGQAASVVLDDSVSHFSDRLNDTRNVTLAAGNLTIKGNASTTTEEVITTLALTTGPSNVTLTPGSGQAAILRLAGSLTTAAAAGALYRGTDLGVNTPGTANSASIVLTHPASQNQVSSVNSAVVLTGGLAPAGNPSIGIIKGSFGDTIATGLGTQLVTYDMDKGIRLLDPVTEYTTTLADGSIVTDNVKGSQTLTAATTANALWLNGSASVSGAGTLTLTSGTLLVTGTGNTVSKTIATGTNVLSIGGPGDVTFDSSSGITTSGGLSKMGAGTLTLNAHTAYSGITWLHSGTVNVGFPTAIASGNGTLRFFDGTLQNSSGSAMNLNNPIGIDGTMRIGGSQDLTFFGDVTLNSATREINVTNTGLTTLSGLITSNQSNIDFGLTKTGPGVLALSNGSNTYDGLTTVSGGELRLTNTTGSATGVGGILVQNGGTLSGTLSGTGRAATGPTFGIQIDGTLSIGSAPGTQESLELVTNTIGTGFNLGATGKMNFGLFTNTGLSGDNTGILTASDLLILTTNAININATTQLILENPNNMSTWAIGDKWQLWQIGGSPAISGSIPYYNIIAPWFVFNDRSFDFNANTGVLSIVAGVPEPSRAILMMLGLLGVMMRRRR